MKDAITILGPTASGKTKLAVALAYELNGEVLSIDSRQVYQGMDIGTGKDLADYSFNSRNIPYHLIDLVPAGSDYHIHRFQKDFASAFEFVRKSRRLPILCGGSGMYLQAVLENFVFTQIPINQQLRDSLDTYSDKALLGVFNNLTDSDSKLQTDTRKRLIRSIEIAFYLKLNPNPEPAAPAFQSMIIGLNPNRDERRERIVHRLLQRIQSGMIEEVQNLMDNGVSAEKLKFYGLEYRYTVEYLLGNKSYDQFIEELTIAIQQYAKRQMTFFRKMEKDGLKIHWFHTFGDSPIVIQKILHYWKKQ